MTEEKSFGPHIRKAFTYRELPIGAISIGIHKDVLRTGTWRALRPVLRMKTPPCNEACPAGVDVRGFISLIKKQRFKEAYKIYIEENPFPSICGRVCSHPCEDRCNRKYFDQAVRINALERFLADFDSPFEKNSPTSGKMVAIIGSGPAGMSCSYYLAKLGHQVIVFEALDVIGGLFRAESTEGGLPVGIVNNEVEKLKALGIEFRTKHHISKENWKELETFDAIVLAGASEHLPEFSFLPKGIGHFNQTDSVSEIGTAGKARIFACGAAIHQLRNVAHTVGSGKKTAIAIDCYLKGRSPEGIASALMVGDKGRVSFKDYVEGKSFADSQKVVQFTNLNPDYFQHKARYKTSKLTKTARANLSLEEALEEAHCCFNCGMCDQCQNCYLLCPDGAILLKEEPPSILISYRYCKGCGICANECPVGYIEMEREG